MGHVEIDEVHTDLVITDAVGPLSAEDMRKVIAQVMEHIRDREDHAKRRREDDSVGDRAYVSDVNERR